eukprot:CAMPEP_0179042150 /NCGR_PEP_ID=MMETSP0796-20121207/16519_1 /TAXON_ID=73915 /ORGANISM="Pyrodinium bahamense, Strain pbaha01" /LENGTH=116 /DNA_ID=CAMNT_0020738527 /DNA_START=400 /DNA_END=750 /DNA_ORIENTATION=-
MPPSSLHSRGGLPRYQHSSLQKALTSLWRIPMRAMASQKRLRQYAPSGWYWHTFRVVFPTTYCCIDMLGMKHTLLYKLLLVSPHPPDLCTKDGMFQTPQTLEPSGLMYGVGALPMH